ncbi:MAG: PASTA domain-containing protein [Rikenellaceae bacterium]
MKSKKVTEKPTPRGTAKPKVAPKQRGERLGWALVLNLIIIALLVVGGAVGAHFLMCHLTRHEARVVVPEFTGTIITDARGRADTMELKIIINDSLYAPAYPGGMILDQLPESGAQVKPGRAIYVSINTYRAKRVDVPYVAGRSLRQAINMLAVAGLEIDSLIYKEDMATNYIIAQYLGNQPVTQRDTLWAEIGSGVKLHVGRNKDATQPTIPDLLGTSLASAKRTLWSRGLNLGFVRREEGINLINEHEAMIYYQSAPAEMMGELGEAIDIDLTLSRAVVDSVRLAIELEELRLEELMLEIEAMAADSLLEIERVNQEIRMEIEETEINFDNFF